MGSSSSTTSPSTTTSQQDNRVAVGNDGASVGAFGSYYRNQTSASAWNSGNTNTNEFRVDDSSVHDFSTKIADSRDLSTRIADSHDWSDSSVRNTSSSIGVTDSRDLSTYFSDSSARDYSNRSVTNVTGTDGGSVQMAQWNAQLLGAVSEQQTDAVRLIAKMGADGVSRQAEAATSLFATGSAEASAAWGHTVDKSYDAIDKLLTSAQFTVAGAQTVARDAISSFQPTANAEAAGSSRIALYAGLAVGGLVLLKH